MDQKKEPSPVAILWKWAEKYHGGFYIAVLMAVLGVAGTMFAYVSVAQIIRVLIEQKELKACIPWILGVAAGYVVKAVCSTASTALSHTATYHTLRDLREQMLKKLSRMPMGTILDTPSGQYKTTIVDRVEGMEPTLAHLIPEMTANLVVPIAIAVYIFRIDWRMGLASLVTTIVGMLGASMDKAEEIDQTPVMDIDGKDQEAENGEVAFEEVSFSYSEDPGARKILDQVSFTIPAQSTTAVVGPSGGGKTTMCSLIARFWDVTEGRITIGGTDVKEFKLDRLMTNISMVFQNVYLFQDTIENNIRFGKPEATHEEVVKAAKAACCHDFIEALPNGYQTVLGEGGGTLSGGEKQRISIARAILKDAPIIILDEATASVDPENKDLLQAAIEALTHDKTIIMIAHRLKTVRHADQILVLDHRKIVQQGTHEQLAQEEGLYKEFLKARKKAASWKLA